MEHVQPTITRLCHEKLCWQIKCKEEFFVWFEVRRFLTHAQLFSNTPETEWCRTVCRCTVWSLECVRRAGAFSGSAVLVRPRRCCHTHSTVVVWQRRIASLVVMFQHLGLSERPDYDTFPTI